MPDLYLTPTRRELLEAVHERRVIEGHEDDHTWLVYEFEHPKRKVCARIKEAERAGWVTLPEGVGPFWELTEAGRKALGWS